MNTFVCNTRETGAPERHRENYFIKIHLKHINIDNNKTTLLNEGIYNFNGILISLKYAVQSI